MLMSVLTCRITTISTDGWERTFLYPDKSIKLSLSESLACEKIILGLSAILMHAENEV